MVGWMLVVVGILEFIHHALVFDEREHSSSRIVGLSDGPQRMKW
jgi:uncharacterized membrane protein HdeD (DUF308 family)